MPDERTDEEAHEDEQDAEVPLFTATTTTPRIPANNPISRADAKIQNATIYRKAVDPGYTYRDTRGHWWFVKWNPDSFTWNAIPQKETIEWYNANGLTTKLFKGRTFAASTDSPGLISAVESNLEMFSPSRAPSSFPWWLLVVGYFLMKGKRRR